MSQFTISYTLQHNPKVDDIHYCHKGLCRVCGCDVCSCMSSTHATKLAQVLEDALQGGWVVDKRWEGVVVACAPLLHVGLWANGRGEWWGVGNPTAP